MEEGQWAIRSRSLPRNRGADNTRYRGGVRSRVSEGLADTDTARVRSTGFHACETRVRPDRLGGSGSDLFALLSASSGFAAATTYSLPKGRPKRKDSLQLPREP